MLLCVGSRQVERPHVSFEDFYASPERERERSVSLPVGTLNHCRERDSMPALSIGERQLEEMKELVFAGSARVAAAAGGGGGGNEVESRGNYSQERNEESYRVLGNDSAPCCRSLSASAALPSRHALQQPEHQQRHHHHHPQEREAHSLRAERSEEQHQHDQERSQMHGQEHALPPHLHVHQHLAFEFATAFTSSLSPSEVLPTLSLPYAFPSLVYHYLPSLHPLPFSSSLPPTTHHHAHSRFLFMLLETSWLRGMLASFEFTQSSTHHCDALV